MSRGLAWARWAAAGGLALCWLSSAEPQAEPAVLRASTHEPRAYGYQVGDRLQRELHIEVPTGLQLAPNSLPRPGGRGQAIELRGVTLQSETMPGGRMQTLRLDYQVLLAPRQVRTLEIAPIDLRYTGGPREQSLRIEAWPVTVAPLLPQVVSPRQGLGEMQPDLAPPRIDEAPLRQRLRLWAALVALGLAWLSLAGLAWPWWQRRHQPFGQAWARLHRLPDAPEAEQWLAGCRSLHQAINQSAGQAVFEAGLASWLARQPVFLPLQAELLRFLRLSHQAFFAMDGQAPRDGAWLRGLGRRCREAERGG